MGGDGSGRFHTTHWSLIAALPKRADQTLDGRSQEALKHLCETYWQPLYAFARYSGWSAEDAQDQTQAFLAKVVEDSGLGGATPERGRFRSYLLGAMKHFMANTREHAKAKKRGGGHRFVHGDVAEIESGLSVASQPGTAAEVDLAFDRTWAQQTTSAALDQLKREWSDRGKSDQFEILHPSLTSEIPDRPVVADRLGMTENALNVTIHRLRQRYAALVREAVSRTVADEGDIEDELRYLVGVLRGKS